MDQESHLPKLLLRIQHVHIPQSHYYWEIKARTEMVTIYFYKVLNLQCSGRKIPGFLATIGNGNNFFCSRHTMPAKTECRVHHAWMHFIFKSGVICLLMQFKNILFCPCLDSLKDVLGNYMIDFGLWIISINYILHIIRQSGAALIRTSSLFNNQFSFVIIICWLMTLEPGLCRTGGFDVYVFYLLCQRNVAS